MNRSNSLLAKFVATFGIASIMMAAPAWPAAAAGVSLDPSSGPSGTMVTATGSASTAGASCKTAHVYFGATRDSSGKLTSEGTQVASGSCGAEGAFSVPFKVPDKATKGTALVMAERYGSGGKSLTKETAEFTVT